jgi:hypothetical protein
MQVHPSIHQQQSTLNKIPKKQLLPRAYLRLSAGHNQSLNQGKYWNECGYSIALTFRSKPANL